MGTSTSKAAKTASKLSASNTARKYPTRTPTPSSNRINVQPRRHEAQESLGPTVYPEPTIAEGRMHKINQDSQDPDLGLQARLQSLGPVQPNPTLSNTSTFNITSRPGLVHTRDKDKNKNAPSLSPTRTSQQTNQDPSLTHSQFQPSASNPAQSIFPSAQQAPHARDNPAISVLMARQRLAGDAEHEFAQVGREGAEGRRFLDVVTLRQVLLMRDERGMPAGRIEEELGLRQGVLATLGMRGVVGIGS